jgi:hypothetical protein
MKPILVGIEVVPMKPWPVLLSISLLIHAVSVAQPLEVTSPDGRLRLAFTAEATGPLAWSFAADGRTLVNASPLGPAGVDQPWLVGSSRRSVNTVWNPVWGKRRGGFEVEITWDGGILQQAKVTSLLGRPLCVRMGERVVELATKRGKHSVFDSNLKWECR